MSSREAITQYIVDKIAQVRYVKSVTREPKSLEELSRNSFPHVLVETANEVRDNSSFGQTIRQQADLDLLINIVVHGEDRDSQRNLILEAVERKLHEDSTLGGLAMDSLVTRIQIREIAEADPYATAAMVYTVRYYYNRGNP